MVRQRELHQEEEHQEAAGGLQLLPRQPCAGRAGLRREEEGFGGGSYWFVLTRVCVCVFLRVYSTV